MKARLNLLDALRALAVIFMILFHTYYLWTNIFSYDKILFSNEMWYYIWRIWAILFLLISWISYFFAKERYVQNINKKYLKKSFIIGLFAALITLFTYIFLPSQLIIFWILHFFAISFLLLPYFLSLTYILQIIIILVILILRYIIFSDANFPLWFIFGFTYDQFYSADYYPLIPYFFIVVLWYYIWLFIKTYNLKHYLSTQKDYKTISFLQKIWKNSLLIYIIHQPIIFTIFYILEVFFK